MQICIYVAVDVEAVSMGAGDKEAGGVKVGGAGAICLGLPSAGARRYGVSEDAGALHHLPP